MYYVICHDKHTFHTNNHVNLNIIEISKKLKIMLIFSLMRVNPKYNIKNNVFRGFHIMKLSQKKR